MKMNELLKFCSGWLAAWTGNRPETLLNFYHDDALYIDPANREGLKGHREMRRYLERLLAANPEWIWRPVEVFPIETGAIVKWACEIPVGAETICETGLDIVEIVGGKITRNEVYFDRTQLLAAIERSRRER
jgi:hypothetical protein